MKTLTIKVGRSTEESFEKFIETAEALEAGKEPVKYFGIGLDSISRMNKLFTPKRWELIEQLKALGAVSIYALAKHLKRDYKNVRTDVIALIEWGVIEKDETDKVLVPWDEIDVKWPILKDVA